MPLQCIDSSTMTHQQLRSFIQIMKEAIGATSGKRSNYIVELGLDLTSPFAFLLGRDNFTQEQKVFAEGIFCIVMNIPMRRQEQLWINGTTWYPKNKNRIEAPMEQSRLDYDFMLEISDRPKDWEEILKVSSTTFTKLTKGDIAPYDLIRPSIALMQFGFPEPEQFFTRI